MSHKYADFDLVIDGRVLEFRTTLRAAYVLDQRYKGLENLFTDIIAEKLSAAWDVLKQTAKDNRTRDEVERLKSKPLEYWWKDGLFARLVSVVASLAGIDHTAPKASGTPSGKRLTYREHFDFLYERATGWLGYSPEQAWQSTPIELDTAITSRIEFLKLTTGHASKDDRSSPSNEELDVAGLNDLKLMEFATH